MAVSKNVTILTTENYKDEVMGQDKMVVIDFWASWCGPCSMLSPILEEIANEMPDIKVCKVNVDEQQELQRKFQIINIPTLAFIKNDKLVGKSVGFFPKEELKDTIKEYL